EHIEIGPPGEGQCDGTVDVVEYLGADSFVVIDCGAALGSITVRVIGDTGAKPGEHVGLRFDPDRLSFFDADGLRV
ncbi:MAG: TOBE domain-containing protein, partial [Pseudomonadota bacterium]